MISIAIRLDIPRAVERLRRIGRDVGDLRPVLRSFGEHMVGSVKRNFEVGGRPPWPPSIRAIRTGGRTLVDRATLRNSIQVRRVEPDLVEVGTNVAYGGVHQEGFAGTVQIPQHLRRVRTRDRHGMERRVSKKTGKKYSAKVIRATGFAVVSAHVRQLRIPARPFLVVQPEDYAAWTDLVDAHVRNLTEEQA